MCLFSLPIRHVSKTRIFARSLADQTQFLAYSMSLDVSAPDGELAMVLPIPVPPESSEEAVTFVDMSSAKNFFDVIDAYFPVEISRGIHPQSLGRQAPPPSAILKVHDVGDFEASFVPSREDFARLDARFRLSPDVWDALPQYVDWGFCVFKLRVARAEATALPRPPDGVVDRVVGLFKKVEPVAPATPTREFHPMAFAFPRRDPSQLFFPTVHVHDGKVHPHADFDHTLYCQVDVRADDQERRDLREASMWEESLPLDPHSVPPNIRAFLTKEQPKAHRLKLTGSFPNRDIYVA